MTTREFGAVATIVPPILIAGFIEASRRWPGEPRKHIGLALLTAVFIIIGWLNAKETTKTWSLRLCLCAAAVSAWSLLLGSSVYPGLFHDMDQTWPGRLESACRIFGVALVAIGGAFGLTRVARAILPR